MAQQIGISPFAILLGLLVGAAWGGVIGICLAIPTAAIASVLLADLRGAIRRARPRVTRWLITQRLHNNGKRPGTPGRFLTVPIGLPKRAAFLHWDIHERQSGRRPSGIAAQSDPSGGAS